MANKKQPEPHPYPIDRPRPQTEMTKFEVWGSQGTPASQLAEFYAPSVYRLNWTFFANKPNHRDLALETTHDFLHHFFLEVTPPAEDSDRQSPTAPPPEETALPSEPLSPRYRVFFAVERSKRGRFLAYLHKSLTHFRVSNHRRDSAAFRGGDRIHMPLIGDLDKHAGSGTSADSDPYEAFVRDVECRLCDLGIQQLKAELSEPKRPLDCELWNCLVRGTIPKFARLARKLNQREAFVEFKWNALLIDHALLPHLRSGQAPYAQIEQELGSKLRLDRELIKDNLYAHFKRLIARLRRIIDELSRTYDWTKKPW